MKSRTPYPQFASFVVETERGDGHSISDPTKWKNRIAIKEFRGRMADAQIGEVVCTDRSMSEHIDCDMAVGETTLTQSGDGLLA